LSESTPNFPEAISPHSIISQLALALLLGPVAVVFSAALEVAPVLAGRKCNSSKFREIPRRVAHGTPLPVDVGCVMNSRDRLDVGCTQANSHANTFAFIADPLAKQALRLPAGHQLLLPPPQPRLLAVA
jgi:hypothetical protein